MGLYWESKAGVTHWFFITGKAFPLAGSSLQAEAKAVQEAVELERV